MLDVYKKNVVKSNLFSAYSSDDNHIIHYNVLLRRGINMASQKKVDWWRNLPFFTKVIDMTIPFLATLPNQKYLTERNNLCTLLSTHPQATKHHKSFKAFSDHIDLNVELYKQGKPYHH
jgi:hypothetical protein